jgi:hypothetical protein
MPELNVHLSLLVPKHPFARDQYVLMFFAKVDRNDQNTLLQNLQIID